MRLGLHEHMFVRRHAYGHCMGTAETGNATEAAVLNAFVERGFDVLLPFGGGQAFDLVVHVDGQFLRIQCKTARQRGGCLAFNSRTTDHGRGRLPYDGLADLFGVFAPSTSGVYLVPVSAASTYISISGLSRPATASDAVCGSPPTTRSSAGPPSRWSRSWSPVGVSPRKLPRPSH